MEVRGRICPLQQGSGDETGYSRIAESKSRWISAFGVWLLSQSKEFPFMAIGEPDYYNVLKNLELEKKLKFIDEYPYDIADYISNVDTNNNLAYVLAIQQYGGLTTMLDVTDDIDVAIFFTQSKLNKATNVTRLMKTLSMFLHSALILRHTISLETSLVNYLSMVYLLVTIQFLPESIIRDVVFSMVPVCLNLIHIPIVLLRKFIYVVLI